ncbi:hypothetical protein Lal_00046565 [Lupinus albus]|nr:hypothetical protein Lal_00046565 [Lupinus albus]
MIFLTWRCRSSRRRRRLAGGVGATRLPAPRYPVRAPWPPKSNLLEAQRPSHSSIRRSGNPSATAAGLCCLQKLEDEDDGAVYYTRIACKLLDLKTCRCTNYPKRRDFVPDCIQLTPAQADEFRWLPPTCGYRLVAEGKDLPPCTRWSVATPRRCTTPASPSPGAWSARPRWPRTTGRTIMIFGGLDG